MKLQLEPKVGAAAALDTVPVELTVTVPFWASLVKVMVAAWPPDWPKTVGPKATLTVAAPPGSTSIG